MPHAGLDLSSRIPAVAGCGLTRESVDDFSGDGMELGRLLFNVGTVVADPRDAWRGAVGLCDMAAGAGCESFAGQVETASELVVMFEDSYKPLATLAPRKRFN